MEAGALVSDDILIIACSASAISSRTARAASSWTVFPAPCRRPRRWTRMLEERGMELDAVIELRVDDAALIERIAGRFTCAKCGAGYHDKLQAAEGRRHLRHLRQPRVRPPRRRPAGSGGSAPGRVPPPDRADPASLRGPGPSAHRRRHGRYRRGDAAEIEAASGHACHKREAHAAHAKLIWNS